MSCWVVPLIAAELWGISVEQVYARVDQGLIASKSEQGFIFVDVAPDAPQAMPPGERPPTYTIVTRSEQDALTDDLAEQLDAVADGDHIAIGPPTEEEGASGSAELADWRQVRSQVARQRRAPKAA